MSDASSEIAVATAPEPVAAGQFLAVPFRFNGQRAAVNEALIDGCLHLPNLFPLPASEFERKVVVASWLTDPNHMFWEVWYRGALVGILGLTRITFGLDALAHLAFFDRQLFGRRALVQQMICWAFRELHLQRLTVEIPEKLDALIRFTRTKLGFRYEGESLVAANPALELLRDSGINNADKWVAKFGSRRQGAYWTGEAWGDLVVLRLCREECAELGSSTTAVAGA